MEEKKQAINLDIKPEIAKGVYSNLAIITHSHSEFIVDFAEILPGLPKPEINSRIILTPEHAKRLSSALLDNISKYESQFGPIQMGQAEPKPTFNLADFNAGNGTKS